MLDYGQLEEQPTARFVVDLEAGTMMDKELGSRVMTLTAGGWSELKNELDSTFMSGASVIYQRMGYSYGRYLAKRAKLAAAKSKKVTASNDAWEILVEASKTHGWGKLSLISGNFATGNASLVVRGCVFCAADKKGPLPRCNYLVGLVVGLADEMTGMSHKATEKRCFAKDDALCEIQLERIASAPIQAPRA